MKQITEDYVSYEIAVLLKEKEFDEPVNRFYEISTGKPSLVRSEYCRNSFTTNYAAPTHQMALKWLREVYKWSIQVFPVFDNLKWCYDIYELKIQKYQSRPELLSNVDYNTYEEAVEAALKYCLEHYI